MAIQLSDNIFVGQQKPVEAKYFNGLSTWASVAAVNNQTTGIADAVRYRGLTVNIDGVEYWYKDGIADTNLVIKTAGGSGTVTGITMTTPLTGGTINVSGTIGIQQAGASLDGYLSSGDWTIFNNKQNTITNPVTGTGTQNFVTKWSATTGLIADSSIFDNGTSVGIGISTGLTKKLTIDGNMWMKHSSDIKDSGLSMGSQINYITFRPTATGSIGGNDLAIDMFYEQPPFATGSGFNDRVTDIAIQSDGKVICVGFFTTYNGIPASGIIRLNTDGTKDTLFDYGSGFNGLSPVNKEKVQIILQSDGKILVGGNFTTYNVVGANRIIRLNLDGSIDTSFVYGSGFNKISGGFFAFALQNDGKIIVGGDFNLYNGVSANSIIRLNTDGSIDTSFVGGGGFIVTPEVTSIVIQSDGKILCGGFFSTYQGVNANRIIRLNIDGSIDTSFVYGNGFNNGVYEISLQSDGKILVGGLFTTYNVVGANRIIRLNTDGSIDTSFVYGSGFNNDVLTIAIQSDGKIICGGDFLTYNTVNSRRIIRLNTDGSKDTSWAIGNGFSNEVYALSIQNNGNIFVGGRFTNFDTTITAIRIIRLLQSEVQSGTTRLTIKRDTGNVGIGTTTPTAKLDINGTFHTTGENTLDDLIGTGTRMVTASELGVLGTAPVPTGTSPLTTKGDLYTRNSSADARLGVGSSGQYLTADPAETTGLKWVTFSGGGGARIIVPVTADITGGTAAGTDYVYLVNQTTLVTVTLPSASSNTNSYTIKKIGTGQVNIATTAGTIDGSASPITINVQNVSLTLVTDGTNWFII